MGYHETLILVVNVKQLSKALIDCHYKKKKQKQHKYQNEVVPNIFANYLILNIVNTGLLHMDKV